jgi:hypothetical protein
MRKATATLLAAGLLFAASGAGIAQAADRAGVGLEWGIGPVIQMGDFDMKFGQAFGVNWKVNEQVSVAIFGEQAPFRGEYSYSNDTGTVAFDQGIQVNGNYSVSGMRIMHELPILKIIDIGFELGVVSLGEGPAPRYHNSNGSTGSAADFGTVNPLDATGALEGIAVHLGLFKAESGTLSTELGINAALRFVQLPDTFVFGTQEVTTTKPAAEKAGIDAVTSYNNITLQVALNVGF